MISQISNTEVVQWAKSYRWREQPKNKKGTILQCLLNMEHLRTMDGEEMCSGKRSRDSDEEEVLPKKKRKYVKELTPKLVSEGRGRTLSNQNHISRLRDNWGLGAF